MLFEKTYVDFDLNEIADFIEKPCQECQENELKNYVSKVLVVLNKNPVAISNIITTHPFIPPVFLLDDLAEKMQKQNCIEKLGILFEKCLDELTEACTFNMHDLKRFINTRPLYSDKIIQKVISNEHYFKRILASDNNPEITLKEMIETYPQFQKQFSELYNKCFNLTPTLR